MQSVITFNSIVVSSPELLKNGLYELNNTLPSKGLFLTNKEINKLVSARDRALKESGRVEIGEGIIPQIANEFSSCVFINRKNFASVLERLIFTFFNVKTAVSDKISDNNLVRLMKDYYENKNFSSIEVFPETDTEILVQIIENENRQRKTVDFSDYEGYFDERS